MRKRKLEFNELVHSIKKFETHDELQSKISQVELEISQMEAEYERETASFAEKERCLRIAVPLILPSSQPSPSSSDPTHDSYRLIPTSHAHTHAIKFNSQGYYYIRRLS